MMVSVEWAFFLMSSPMYVLIAACGETKEASCIYKLGEKKNVRAKIDMCCCPQKENPVVAEASWQCAWCTEESFTVHY